MVAGRTQNIKELCIQERHKHDKEEMVALMMMDDTIFYKRKDYIRAPVDKRK